VDITYKELEQVIGGWKATPVQKVDPYGVTKGSVRCGTCIIFGGLISKEFNLGLSQWNLIQKKNANLDQSVLNDLTTLFNHSLVRLASICHFLETLQPKKNPEVVDLSPKLWH